MAAARRKASKLTRNVVASDGNWYGPAYPNAEPTGDVLEQLQANPALWEEQADDGDEESTTGEG